MSHGQKKRANGQKILKSVRSQTLYYQGFTAFSVKNPNIFINLKKKSKSNKYVTFKKNIEFLKKKRVFVHKVKKEVKEWIITL